MMFIELHTRSAFSFLASGSQPERLAERASELGIETVALLDRDTVAGAVRFHFEAKERGVRPIIGAEITMDDGSLLPLLPMNLAGYQNLSKLITTVKLRHKKGEHFATRRDIEEHSANLICLTGGSDGFMHAAIKRGSGLADLAWLNYVFERRLYVELQRHHLRHEEYLNQQLTGYAHKLRLPMFASNGVYYADEHDRELFDVFTCIKNHTTIYDAGRLLSENGERHLKTESQMRRLFADQPEVIDITQDIAARIDFSMDELAYTFPDYPVPRGETMDSVLRQMATQRSLERYRHTPWPLRSQVQGRLEKEFRVIEQKKLAGYFLVVNDISDYCRENKILSQGRGSAANSVVCYALGITAVEPIANKLLFERFLSAGYERYPDIDLDLPSGDDRESVIQHVYKKYGERSAGMTANVICYRGKSAVREVGKTFGFGPEVLTRLSKLNSYYETFKGAELEARLKENGFDPTTDIRLRKFGEMYHRILTFPRHLGQHSGGMVVSLDRLDGVTPLEPASMPGRNIIQWDKDDCEALKIVKVDLLGLGMMAVLRDSIELIRTHHGEEMGLYKIPHDDPKVYETLQIADTVGMFQVESRAQIAFLPKSRPENFYDIVVQVAIIRPGPIVGNMLSSYIKRRQGLEEVDYMHPLLEPTLKRTMGVPLFQEQLLKIAMDVADFSGSEAEELRRAMGFKRPDRKLERISRNLRNGMSKNGIPEDIQEKIVNYVKAFANYGFPESHAYSFALLAYASAYFIVHYRACFMVAMFNNYPLGFYSAATLVKDAQRHGLHFIALDINRSDYDFTVEEVDGELQVRVGLRFVRGLREEIGRKIVEERDRPSRLCRLAERRSSASPEDAPHSLAALSPISVPRAGGIAADPFEHVTEKHSFSANRAAEPHIKSIPYTSIADLIDRVPEINKREIRALSLAGALNFDNTVHRREALWESELAMQPEGSLFEKSSHPYQGGVAAASADGVVLSRATMPFLTRMEGLQLVDADLRKTGISIGKHPLAFLRDKLSARGVITAHDARYLVPGQVARLAGAVIVRQRPMTAKNVVFITLEDETGHSNFVVMPDKFEEYRAIINGNDFLIIKGIFEERGMLKAIHFENLADLDTTVVSHNFR